MNSGKESMAAQESQSNLDRLLDRIVEAFVDYGELTDTYPWVWEEDRWHELVFCLLARIGQPELSTQTARNATLTLRNLGFLDLETLADSAPMAGEPDYERGHVSEITKVLQRLGFTVADSKTAAATICDVARGLAEQHDGKVQKYLRHYGQLMIDQLPDHFTFSRLEAQDARYAFTHWLQQALNIPLALSDPSIETLCRQYDVAVEDLLAEIDERDLNVAFLDELAIELVAREEAEPA